MKLNQLVVRYSLQEESKRFKIVKVTKTQIVLSNGERYYKKNLRLIGCKMPITTSIEPILIKKEQNND